MKTLFDLQKRSSKERNSKIVAKAASSKSLPLVINVRGSDNAIDNIKQVAAIVEQKLGHLKDYFLLIRNYEEFVEYIDKAIEDKEIAIDTETSGLDPLTDSIAGICLYSKSQKPCYVPINHLNHITNARTSDQLSEYEVAEQLERLKNIDIFMHNSKFDLRFIKNQLNVELTCTHDSYIAAKLLNENEREHNLKYLHNRYCSDVEQDTFSFSDLFKGINFVYVPIKTGYLYAANDALITYELAKFQQEYFDKTNAKCINKNLEDVSDLFYKIEMPLVKIVAQTEDNGISFDFDFAEKLSKKYNKKLEEAEAKFFEICEKFKDEIEDYRAAKNISCQLSEPININSPLQIAIIIYDILKIKPVDKRKPRGTGEGILTKIKHPIAKAILEYREIAKLLSTYIDKMPNIVNEKTGKIHTSFNQMGTDTGRFSSSNPNLQNIPARNNEIRKMFRASEGCVLLSSDYSAQEPRLTAHMTQDKKMIQAYKEGKDLYVEIASMAFNKTYEECLETNLDGSPNPEGKKRRYEAKQIVLGILYGKGINSIADDLKVPKKKAQKIYDSVLNAFPDLRKFMIDSQNMARELGYVTTNWGRKRRLPSMQLPQYEFTYVGSRKNFDPLSFESKEDFEISERTKSVLTNKLNRAYSWKAKEAIKKNAKEEGIKIKDNTMLIAEATRQCVNSRIQGSAADQTKIAMILVGNDEKLKQLDFKLLLTVHDELIGECPKENAKEVAERFSNLMIDAAKDLLVPSKCDVEITEQWYGKPLHIA